MEILQILLSAFLGEEKKQKIEPLLKILSDNNYDLKKVLHSINPETIAPILKEFLNLNKNSRTETVRQTYGTSPIAKIADKEIIYSLNKYLGD